MRKSKHKKENTKKKKIILNIILIVFFISIIICVYNIITWIKNNKDTETLIDEISNAVTVEDNNEDSNTESKDKSYKIDFEQLKATNSDTVAWIKVNGTDIEYPVVKKNDNDFYLTHSFDKSLNGAGWVFADYRNKIDGTDRNIIVYGHNRRDGSMFATLKNILNKSWYENQENRKVIFITEQGQFEYQVFAVYQIEKDNYDTTINFNLDEEFMNYIENAKNRSVYDFNVDVNSADSILTLSTCANDNKYRVVLHSKLVK
ncbi:MAG: class B sortase [Clostridia bacterium]|nr:class B sortase [Clostridia bacterium]